MKLVIFLAALLVLPDFCSGQQIELVVPGYHTQPVTSLDLSPDGKFLITASRDHSIILREAFTGNFLRQFDEGMTIRGVRFLNDSRSFLVNTDSGIVVRDIIRKTIVQTIKGDFLELISGKKRTEFVAIQSDGAVKLYQSSYSGFRFDRTIDTLSGKRISCSFSGDGDLLLLLSRNFRVFNMVTKKLSTWQIQNLPDSLIKSVALSYDRQTMALGLISGSIKLYDVNLGVITRSLELYHPYYAGNMERGIYRDSARLNDACVFLEFMENKKLMGYYRPDGASINPRSNYPLRWGKTGGDLVSSEDLDRMWTVLQLELDKEAAGPSMLESDWWGLKPTMAIWDVDQPVPVYSRTGPELISASDDKVVSPESILDFRSWENVPIEEKSTRIGPAQFSAGEKKIFFTLNFQPRIFDVRRGTNKPFPFPVDHGKFQFHKNTLVVSGSHPALYDPDEERTVHEFPVQEYYNLFVNPVKEQMAEVNSEGKIRVVDFKGNGLVFEKDYRISSYDLRFSNDGELMTIKAKSSFHIFRTSDFTLLDSIPPSENGYDFESAVDQFAVGKDKVFYTTSTIHSNALQIRDVWQHKTVDSVRMEDVLEHIVLSPDEKWIGATHGEGMINIIDAMPPHNQNAWKGHDGSIVSLEFNQSGTILMTAGEDGFIKFWNAKSRELLARMIFYGEDWVIVGKDGLFDGSAGGMEKLFFLHGLETIELSQLKDRFYEPGLLSKILGQSQEPLRKSQGLNNIKLFPRIQINRPDPKENARFAIHLSSQGGGIGTVKVSINGKEAFADARGTSTGATDMVIPLDLSGHPFLKSNELNVVEVRAYNEEGYLVSPPKKMYYMAGGERSSSTKLYAVVIGTSDYNGTQLDLHYAARDAEQFGFALQETGARLLGKDNVEVAFLTTDRKDSWPTKENIRKAFEQTGKKAKAADILIVYLAGHGTNYGGEESDFYYLAADAQNGNLSDPAVRSQVAISSHEFTEYIKWIPALKQVMILDACHSGKFAEDLLAKREAKTAGEIRALERMKDRTGMYILSGSAADAVSYEASSFGQGLLTYSLLFGMKGAALRDNKYIDVMKLFQYSADEVPRMAMNIGGIQKPEVRVPYGGESFDMGMLDEEINKRIVLPTPKPVFLRSVFQDEETFADPLGLSEALDEQLKNYHKGEGGGDVIFIDASHFTDGYSLRGRYKKSGNTYEVMFKLLKGDRLLADIKVSGQTREELVEKMIAMGIQKAEEGNRIGK